MVRNGVLQQALRLLLGVQVINHFSLYFGELVGGAVHWLPRQRKFMADDFAGHALAGGLNTQ